MHWGPADKLPGVQLHTLAPISPIVLIAERYQLFVHADEELITDRNPIALAREVTDDAFGVIKTRLAINTPSAFALSGQFSIEI